MKLLREGRSFSGRERNCAFMNCDGQAFANISAVSGLNYDDDGRALAVSDWDQDGDLDLWFLNRTGPRLRLMINQSDQRSSQSNKFVAFQLQGTESNRICSLFFNLKSPRCISCLLLLPLPSH